MGGSGPRGFLGLPSSSSLQRAAWTGSYRLNTLPGDSFEGEKNHRILLLKGFQPRDAHVSRLSVASPAVSSEGSRVIQRSHWTGDGDGSAPCLLAKIAAAAAAAAFWSEHEIVAAI